MGHAALRGATPGVYAHTEHTPTDVLTFLDVIDANAIVMAGKDSRTAVR